jgi:aryl-alcohol dehydrogenase (NADP+)
MVKLGTTELDVFPICLGGNVFGWTADEQTSFRVLDAYTAAGGNFIDTADVYMAGVPGNAGGESETIIGRWLAKRGRRDDVVIATKVGSWNRRPGLGANNVRAAVEDSLRRLGTTHIDLYYAHRDDESAPLEETLGAFEALVRPTATPGAAGFPARGPGPLRGPADALQPYGTRLRVGAGRGGRRARAGRAAVLCAGDGVFDR